MNFKKLFINTLKQNNNQIKLIKEILLIKILMGLIVYQEEVHRVVLKI